MAAPFAGSDGLSTTDSETATYSSEDEEDGYDEDEEDGYDVDEDVNQSGYDSDDLYYAQFCPVDKGRMCHGDDDDDNDDNAFGLDEASSTILVNPEYDEDFYL